MHTEAEENGCLVLFQSDLWKTTLCYFFPGSNIKSWSRLVEPWKINSNKRVSFLCKKCIPRLKYYLSFSHENTFHKKKPSVFTKFTHCKQIEICKGGTCMMKSHNHHLHKLRQL